MANQKQDTLLWFAETIKETPDARLWLASSGAIITGEPIEITEYYQTIFGDPKLKGLEHYQTENVLALKEVEIKIGNTTNIFNVALVDLNLIVAWGGYNLAASYSFTDPESGP